MKFVFVALVVRKFVRGVQLFVHFVVFAASVIEAYHQVKVVIAAHIARKAVEVFQELFEEQVRGVPLFAF